MDYDPNQHLGYGAVVVPAQRYYQAMFLPKLLAPLADDLSRRIRDQLVHEFGIRGADRLSGTLQAIVVDQLLNAQETNAAAAAIALSRLHEAPVFVIVATRHAGGTASELSVLDVAPEHAREAIERLPEVREIQAALMEEAVELALQRKPLQ